MKNQNTTGFTEYTPRENKRSGDVEVLHKFSTSETLGHLPMGECFFVQGPIEGLEISPHSILIYHIPTGDIWSLRVSDVVISHELCLYRCFKGSAIPLRMEGAVKNLLETAADYLATTGVQTTGTSMYACVPVQEMEYLGV